MAAQEAARKAAQEAARKAAEEAARKAAAEAARKAAAEAARKAAAEAAKAAQAADGIQVKKAITTRLSAYDAPPPAPAAANGAPEAASGVPSRFGFGIGKFAAQAASEVKDIAAAAVENLVPAPDPVAEAQLDEVNQATNQETGNLGSDKHQIDVARREQDAKDSNAAVPLDPADERVTSEFDAAELHAYKELAVEDRKKFNDAYQYLHCERTNGRETRGSKGAREAFRKALVEGKLLDADKDGTRVLDHFRNRMLTDLAPELQGKRVDTRGQLQTLAYQVGHPGEVFQGNDTDSCVPASLQANMAARNPGEYMRVATGLVFDGQVTLHGPKGDQVMKLDPDALWKERGGVGTVRATTNQLLQQSFMTFAQESYPPSEGDVLFTGGRYGKGGQYGGSEGGLTLNQAEALFENVSGSYVTPVGVTAANRPQAAETLELATSGRRPVQVGLASDRGGHMVSVMGIDQDADGKKVVTYSDSNDGSEKTMPLDDFMKFATGMVLPSQWAGPFVGAATGVEGGSVLGGGYGGGRAGGRGRGIGG